MTDEELSAAADAVEGVAARHNVGWYFNRDNYLEIATAAIAAYVVMHGKAANEAAAKAKEASKPNPKPLAEQKENPDA